MSSMDLLYVIVYMSKNVAKIGITKNFMKRIDRTYMLEFNNSSHQLYKITPLTKLKSDLKLVNTTNSKYSVARAVEQDLIRTCTNIASPYKKVQLVGGGTEFYQYTNINDLLDYFAKINFTYQIKKININDYVVSKETYLSQPEVVNYFNSKGIASNISNSFNISERLYQLNDFSFSLNEFLNLSSLLKAKNIFFVLSSKSEIDCIKSLIGTKNININITYMLVQKFTKSKNCDIKKYDFKSYDFIVFSGINKNATTYKPLYEHIKGLTNNFVSYY